RTAARRRQRRQAARRARRRWRPRQSRRLDQAAEDMNAGDRSLFESRQQTTAAKERSHVRVTIATAARTRATPVLLMEERISMLKRTILIMAGVFAAVASDARAQTTPPPATLGFVNVNFGAQPGTRDIGRTDTFPLYGEEGTLTTAQENGSGATFDISGGYRFRPNLAGAIGFSNFQNHTDSGVVVTVPHPLVFNSPVTINTSVADLSHSERGIH